jgi:hypothetical protein
VSRSRAFGRVPGPAPAVEIENAPLGTVSTHETRGASKPQTQPTTGRTLNIADLLAGVTLFFQRCRRARPGALPLALEPDAAGLGSGRVPGPAPVGFAIGWQRVSHAKRPACPRSSIAANLARPGALPLAYPGDDGLCRKELIDLIASLIPPGLCHESGFRSLVREARQNHQWRRYDAALAVRCLLLDEADALPKDPDGGLSGVTAVEWLALKQMAGVSQRGTVLCCG